MSSVGKNLKYIAEARLINEQARQQYLDNQLHALQARIAAREMNREARFGRKTCACQTCACQPTTVHCAPQPTPVACPPVSSASQATNLEPVADDASLLYSSDNGDILWPKCLQREDLESQRTVLEELFRQRLSGADQDNQREAIRLAAQGMLTDLQNLIREMRSQDYIDAKRFIERLAKA